MSTALAVQPPSHSSPLRPRDSENAPTSSPRPSTTLSHPTTMHRPARSHSASAARHHNASTSPATEAPTPSRLPPARPPRDSRSPHGSQPSAHPPSTQNGSLAPNTSSPNVPLIKKELPTSPDMRPTSHPSSMSQPQSQSQSRHRPRRLDLSRGNRPIPAAAATVGARPSGSSKDSGGLSALHDVAAACLSPGFQTHDPSVQQQLARSMEMKEQQRQIIEARLHGKPGPEKSVIESSPQSGGPSNMPISARRKGKPPGLSINAPAAHQFAGEPRFVRTAPLDQTFTGLRPGNSLSRQVLDRHPHIAQPPSHGHAHPGAPPGNAGGPTNSLPPISSVLNHDQMGSGSSRSATSVQHGPHANYSPHYGAPSPGYPPPPASAGLPPPPPPPPPPRSHPQAGPIAEPPSSLPPRQREFKSAEEAIQTFSNGRDELLPKVVHYGGHQPPTPPSPRQQGGAPGQQPPAPRAGEHGSNSGGQRRTREEYERDYDERHGDARYFGWDEERGRRAGPAATGPQAPPPRYAPYAHPKDSPDAQRRKKEEFMSLCARAWDLLHS